MIGVMDFGKEENEPYYQLRRIGRPATISGVRDMMKLGPLVTKFGRHSKNDFYLNSQVLENFISRWHAEIHVITDGASKKFMLADKSLNGTYVNNVRVKGHHILQEGDVVAFGHKNGKNVLPGQTAPQDPSEFFFMFEKVVPHDSDYQSESEEPGSPEIAMVPTRPTNQESAGERAALKTTGESVLRDISNGGSAQDSEAVSSSSSEDDIISGAVAAASKFGDADSDDEFDTQPRSSNHQAQQSSASLLSFLKPPAVNNDGKQGTHSKRSTSSSSSSSATSGSSKSSTDPTVSQVFKGPSGWTKPDKTATKSKSTSTKTSGSSTKASPKTSPGRPVNRVTPTSSKKTATNSKSSTTVSSKMAKNQIKNSSSNSKINSVGKAKLNNSTKMAAGTKRKSQKQDDNKPKKRARSKVKDDSSSDDDEAEEDDGSYHYAGDPCDSPGCTFPRASKVSWVQCDDCDKWYHTVCVGCSIDEVEGDAEFQCGCT